MTGDTQTCRQCLVKTKIHVTISEELCGHIVSKNRAGVDTVTEYLVRPYYTTYLYIYQHGVTSIPISGGNSLFS